MNQIVNIEEPRVNDLRPPPAAKFVDDVEHQIPEFDDVVKNSVAPGCRTCSAKKWALVMTFILVTVGWTMFLCAEPWAAEEEVRHEETVGFVDPLNDMLRIFLGQGVETADQACPACFANDPGRLRKMRNSNEAFIVYKSDNGAFTSFEVVTHIFNPQAGPIPTPFSFWTAEDQDCNGQPDAWEPLTPQYKKDDDVMGWERGMFYSGFPMKSFFKISFHDTDAAWRSQLGQVMLMPQAQQPATIELQADQPEAAVTDQMEGVEGLMKIALREFFSNNADNVAQETTPLVDSDAVTVAQEATPLVDSEAVNEEGPPLEVEEATGDDRDDEAVMKQETEDNDQPAPQPPVLAFASASS